MNGKALRDNRPTTASVWCVGEQGRKVKGAVVVEDIFAWHDKSLLLVLLCIAEVETAVLRADMRKTLGQTVGSERGVRETQGSFQVLPMYITTVSFF